MAQHLLLFDIDGTLLHAAGAGRLALRRALTAEFGIAEPLFEVGLAGRTDRAITTEALHTNGIEASEENLARYRDSYFQRLPASLDESGGHVLPGVRPLLSALEARADVVLGLLTGNFERAATMKLEHFGLLPFFRGGAFGDHHPQRDSVARAAHRALSDRAGRDATVWVIGDTPADVRCARAIDARAIAVAAGFATYDELRSADPDHLLEDLADFEHVLYLLDAAPGEPASRS